MFVAIEACRRLVAGMPVCVLSALTLFLASECKGAEIREFRNPGYWYYRGEVEVRPSSVDVKPASAHPEAYCDASYCAHGSGSLGTDSGVTYEGTFVHGRMDGFGTYSNDFVDYVGGFKQGQFSGAGKLTCLDGRLFEGTFSGDALAGKYWMELCAGEGPRPVTPPAATPMESAPGTFPTDTPFGSRR